MIYLLAISSLLLFLLSLVAIFKMKKTNSFWVWIFVPFIIFNMGFSWHTVEQLKGWPYNDYPPSGSVLMHASVTEERIFILSRVNNEDPRLYAVPYSKEMEKKVVNALQSIKEGGTIMIDSENLRPNNSLRFYQYEYQKLHQK